MFLHFTMHFFFFFNDTATTEIYTLSLHDALPISAVPNPSWSGTCEVTVIGVEPASWFNPNHGDRKSTRLNSSHSQISYAVFCLKKKKHISEIYHELYDLCASQLTPPERERATRRA